MIIALTLVTILHPNETLNRTEHNPDDGNFNSGKTGGMEDVNDTKTNIWLAASRKPDTCTVRKDAEGICFI